MAALSYPTRQVGVFARLAARASAAYSGQRACGLIADPNHRLGDWRRTPPARGTVTNNARVMVKPSAEDPERPMPGARVRLHHMRTGACAWQGMSDAQGYYSPYNLQVGASYIPVAIDLSGTYECVASGPVTAELPDA